mmetsp:Transcript_8300/g.25738  ORF Transcript_8300/g.25738 Transcript_8300/m.25738 type:complete len:178 (-) Transcript_8300:185-718(-)
MFNCACTVGPFFGGCDELVGEEDIDLHESLRLYARRQLGAPEDPWAAPGNARELTSDTFGPTLRFVLERSGFPVLKCGNGKGLKRCLMLDKNDMFTWGSKKVSSQHPTAVPLRQIKEVSRTAFTDGPSGANPNAMLIFNINNTHGLKILCESEADAVVLSHGFSIIQQDASRDASRS